jgi:hypothetical protein
MLAHLARTTAWCDAHDALRMLSFLPCCHLILEDSPQAPNRASGSPATLIMHLPPSALMGPEVKPEQVQVHPHLPVPKWVPRPDLQETWDLTERFVLPIEAKRDRASQTRRGTIRCVRRAILKCATLLKSVCSTSARLLRWCTHALAVAALAGACNATKPSPTSATPPRPSGQGCDMTQSIPAVCGMP